MNKELRQAYKQCRDIARRKAGNFYYSFVLLPPEKKRGIYALYAFCQVGDQLADEDAPRDLDVLRERLDACYKGEYSSPLYSALGDTVRKYNLPRNIFHELIAGMESDLSFRGFDTFEELRQYCYKVASTVGLLCIEIFGYESNKVKEYAENLGIALQLTNIIRDVREDYERGRIYIPREDMELFKITEEDFKTNPASENLRKLLKFQYERADSFYRKTEELLPSSEKIEQISSEIMKAIYRELLEEIRRQGFPVMERRVSLSKLKKILLALKTYLIIRFIQA